MEDLNTESEKESGLHLWIPEIYVICCMITQNSNSKYNN